MLKEHDAVFNGEIYWLYTKDIRNRYFFQIEMYDRFHDEIRFYELDKYTTKIKDLNTSCWKSVHRGWGSARYHEFNLDPWDRNGLDI